MLKWQSRSLEITLMLVPRYRCQLTKGYTEADHGLDEAIQGISSSLLNLGRCIVPYLDSCESWILAVIIYDGRTFKFLEFSFPPKGTRGPREKKSSLPCILSNSFCFADQHASRIQATSYMSLKLGGVFLDPVDDVL